MSTDTGPEGHDHDYLTLRESQERAAASNAADPSARRAHEMLADGYAERLRTTMPTAL